jgi:hypothetical protein
MRRAAALSLLLLIAAGCAGAHEAASSPAALLQACVERWNRLHYDHAFVLPPQRSVPARVRAKPCRIEIDYRLSRSDSLYKSYLGMYFPCALNRFQAYVCAEHADGRPGARPRRNQNARYFARDGTIRLNRPPARAVSVPKPDWVRRYPVTAGFIEPFDRNGKLRAGLRFGRTLRSPACATFPRIDRTTLIACGGGRYCFVPRLPVRNHELIACPTDRGSRLFNPGRLLLYPKP